MHEWAHCRDEAANNQLPTAAAFWIIQIVSTEECSSLTQNLMQICCSTCSVILNVTATQFTCSLSGTTAPADWYSEVVTVRACSFRSTPLGCQVTSMSYKPFLLYYQWLDFFCTDLVFQIRNRSFLDRNVDSAALQKLYNTSACYL